MSKFIKQYSAHNPRELEPHFSRHMVAMTAEQLFDKGCIAMELAARDKKIQSLESQNRKYREALESIAKNTCCDSCQEAALVAQQALEVEGD